MRQPRLRPPRLPLSPVRAIETPEQALPGLPFWENLSEQERAQVRSGACLRRFERGALIHGGANDCLGMSLLLAGEIRAYLLSDEGREVTLFRLHPGEVCVLSASCVIRQITFDTQMVAEQACTLLVAGAGVIAALKEQNIHVRCFLYELATARFSDVMWSMQQILFKGLDRRLAGFLVGEQERTGSPTVHMTHEQIAQHISSAREAVARMLKRFSEDGLVELRRGAVRLRDPEALRQLL